MALSIRNTCVRERENVGELMRIRFDILYISIIYFWKGKNKTKMIRHKYTGCSIKKNTGLVCISKNIFF